MNQFILAQINLEAWHLEIEASFKKLEASNKEIEAYNKNIQASMNNIKNHIGQLYEQVTPNQMEELMKIHWIILW